jgi:isoquinoline 1-oxidoreductase subunit beta
VQATVAASGDVRIDHVSIVADVGSEIINPSGAEQQVQGAALDGLGQALGQTITIDHGRVVDENFDSVPPLRINQVPPVEVHFLGIMAQIPVLQASGDRGPDRPG